MIKIGIVGLGNVAWNVHLPVLLSRQDIKINWVCDKNLNQNNLVMKKQISFFTNIDEALKLENCDIILLTVPYSERLEIFEKIKNKCNGIYFEKPYALSVNEHNYYLNSFEKYAITVGYQRRHLGNVKILKNIIEQNIFGKLKSVNIYYGDIHYKFDNFRSNKEKSGGGIFFEAGSHWIDTVLFTSNAEEITNFTCKKKYEDNLDIESEGSFDILDNRKNIISCNFIMSILYNTSNKIVYKFENCFVELHLFDDNSNLLIKTENIKDFAIQDNEFLNFPNNSLDVAWSYWDCFLKSFALKKENETSINNFFLTTKIVEMFYTK